MINATSDGMMPLLTSAPHMFNRRLPHHPSRPIEQIGIMLNQIGAMLSSFRVNPATPVSALPCPEYQEQEGWLPRLDSNQE
jgi:hypothetical protein